MAWTSPLTWTVGQIVTKALLDLHLRDNLKYLKGEAGVPTIESGLTIDNTGGDERLLLPLLSTAECTTVLNAEGEVAFDETTHQMKEYDGTAVRALISEADVDDTPVNGATTVPVSSNWAYDYQNIVTATGDMRYATAPGVEIRLGIGGSGQYLSSNGTIPTWAAGTLTAGCIVIWAGTIANIPAGYVICDGNNSTPNLLARFLEGVATAATNPGTTGGATSKNTAGHIHTQPTHVHTLTVLPSETGITHSGGFRDARNTGAGGGDNTGSQTDSIADIRPLFYDVAFIQKT